MNYYDYNTRQIPCSTSYESRRGLSIFGIIAIILISVLLITFVIIAVLSLNAYKQVNKDLAESKAIIAEMNETLEAVETDVKANNLAVKSEVIAELEAIDEKLVNDADYQKILSDLIKYLEQTQIYKE